MAERKGTFRDSGITSNTDVKEIPAHERALLEAIDLGEQKQVEGWDAARARRRKKEHKLSVIDGASKKLDIKDGDGNVVQTIADVIPQHVEEMNLPLNESVPVLTPGRLQRVTWFGKVMLHVPLFSDRVALHVWQAVAEGHYCPRCLHRHVQASPAACATCMLGNMELHWILRRLEEVGFLRFQSGGRKRLVIGVGDYSMPTSPVVSAKAPVQGFQASAASEQTTT